MRKSLLFSVFFTLILCGFVHSVKNTNVGKETVVDAIGSQSSQNGHNGEKDKGKSKEKNDNNKMPTETKPDGTTNSPIGAPGIEVGIPKIGADPAATTTATGQNVPESDQNPNQNRGKGKSKEKEENKKPNQIRGWNSKEKVFGPQPPEPNVNGAGFEPPGWRNKGNKFEGTTDSGASLIDPSATITIPTVQPNSSPADTVSGPPTILTESGLVLTVPPVSIVPEATTTGGPVLSDTQLSTSTTSHSGAAGVNATGPTETVVVNSTDANSPQPTTLTADTSSTGPVIGETLPTQQALQSESSSTTAVVSGSDVTTLQSSTGSTQSSSAADTPTSASTQPSNVQQVTGETPAATITSTVANKLVSTTTGRSVSVLNKHSETANENSSMSTGSSNETTAATGDNNSTAENLNATGSTPSQAATQPSSLSGADTVTTQSSSVAGSETNQITTSNSILSTSGQLSTGSVTGTDTTTPSTEGTGVTTQSSTVTGDTAKVTVSVGSGGAIATVPGVTILSITVTGETKVASVATTGATVTVSADTVVTTSGTNSPVAAQQVDAANNGTGPVSTGSTVAQSTLAADASVATTSQPLVSNITTSSVVGQSTAQVQTTLSPVSNTSVSQVATSDDSVKTVPTKIPNDNKLVDIGATGAVPAAATTVAASSGSAISQTGTTASTNVISSASNNTGAESTIAVTTSVSNLANSTSNGAVTVETTQSVNLTAEATKSANSQLPDVAVSSVGTTPVATTPDSNGTQNVGTTESAAKSTTLGVGSIVLLTSTGVTVPPNVATTNAISGNGSTQAAGTIASNSRMAPFDDFAKTVPTKIPTDNKFVDIGATGSVPPAITTSISATPAASSKGKSGFTGSTAASLIVPVGTKQGKQLGKETNVKSTLPILRTTAIPAKSKGDKDKQTDNAKSTADSDKQASPKKGCESKHKLCEYWAQFSQCKENDDFMMDQCSLYCDPKCGGKPKCMDIANMCPFWASKGECDKNKLWMNHSCKVSCGTCGK